MKTVPEEGAHPSGKATACQGGTSLSTALTRSYVLWLLLPVILLTGVYAVARWQLRGMTGVTETLLEGVGAGRTFLAERRTRAVGLAMLAEALRPPRGSFTLRWSGAWYVPTRGLYDVLLRAPGRATWHVDGCVAAQAASDRAGEPRTVALGAGFHAIEVEFELEDGTPVLGVAWAPVGGVLQPLNPDHLFPKLPEHPRLLIALVWLASGLRISWLVSLAVFLTAALVGLARVGRKRLAGIASPRARRRIRRVLAVALPVLVVGYAAVLRFDALTTSYGPVSSPGWLHTLQEHSARPLEALRPADVRWDPVPTYPHRDGPPTHYISDPYTYLKFAREMRWFYAAHYREPLFPFLTRWALHALNDQDVAVSFVSAFFSVLVVVVTYLLGSCAFSWWVGLGAAAAVAIEYHMISEGVTGGRDDVFTFAVALCAYAMLRYGRAPSRWNAVLMGLSAGIACLVRITSLSFLLPGLAYLFLATTRPWKERLRGMAVAVFVMTLLVGPYLVSCWYVFGDPLYSINYHTSNYLAAEGASVASRPTAVAYVGAKAFTRPYRTLDTVAVGMTSYPFSNKWDGFDRWIPGLGEWLSYAALIGLVMFAGSGSGRLLLLVLAASLVPYAATWQLAADWRFTQHAYPFFLVASALAGVEAVRWVGTGRLVGVLTNRRPPWRVVVPWLTVFGVLAAGIWMMTRSLPILTARESLRSPEAVTIAAGQRDGAFFAEGWYPPVTAGSVTARVSEGRVSIVEIPLPRVADYSMTVRLDPFPRPFEGTAHMPTVRVFLNRAFLCDLPLRWNPERVGSYDIILPRAAVKDGRNRLVLMLAPGPGANSPDGGPPQPGLSDGAAFRLWYVRVRPPTSQAQ